LTLTLTGPGPPPPPPPRTWARSRRDARAHAHGKYKSTTPDAEYIALMFAQALEDEFDALFEDGSVEAVAADVVALWGAEEDVVREWEGKAEGVRGSYATKA
jgi:hypothetical protein